jgi:hypothetical protein
VLCRAREKLVERRNRKIEEVMKHDPEYKPPADYRCGVRSTRVSLMVTWY